MKRDWSDTVTEPWCRVCRTGVQRPIDRLERAHVIPRRFDPPDGKVNRLAVVTLCGEHHRAYDAGELDLLPYLTIDEQAHAVERVGIIAALRYICGRGVADLMLVPRQGGL